MSWPLWIWASTLDSQLRLLELVLGLLDRGWVLGYGFVPEAQGLGLGDLGLGEAWRRGRWGGDLPSVSPVLFIGLDVEIMVAWSS